MVTASTVPRWGRAGSVSGLRGRRAELKPSRGPSEPPWRCSPARERLCSALYPLGNDSCCPCRAWLCLCRCREAGLAALCSLLLGRPARAPACSLRGRPHEPCRRALKDAYLINGGIFITVYLCPLGGKLPDALLAFITQTSLLLSGSVLLSSVLPQKSAFLLYDADICRICLTAVWKATPMETSAHKVQISVPCYSGY